MGGSLVMFDSVSCQRELLSCIPSISTPVSSKTEEHLACLRSMQCNWITLVSAKFQCLAWLWQWMSDLLPIAITTYNGIS